MVATFNETYAPTSKKYVANSTRYSNAKLIRNFSNFLVALLRFCFLFLKDSLVTTFNETRAPTSRKYVTEQGILMLNLSQHFNFFGRTPLSFH